MTNRIPHAHRRSPDSRKDHPVQHIELRLAAIQERQALLRRGRDADRIALAATRSLRRTVGESLVRLGRRVAGDPMTSPAWQG